MTRDRLRLSRHPPRRLGRRGIRTLAILRTKNRRNMGEATVKWSHGNGSKARLFLKGRVSGQGKDKSTSDGLRLKDE